MHINDRTFSLIFSPLCKLSTILKCFIFILFKIYFIVAVINFIEAQKLDPNISLNFCNGFGFLVILTIVIDWSLFYYKILVPIVQKWIKTSEGHKFQNEISEGKLSQTYNQFMSKWYSSLVINSIVFTSVFIFLLVDTASDRRRLISFFGLIVLILFGVIG